MESTTPITLQLLAGLAVIGAQIVLFAFFQGKMKGEITALDRRIESLSELMRQMEAFRNASVESGADWSARLNQVERSAAIADALRIDFIEHRATSQEQHRQNQEAMARVGRSVDGLSAQLASISRSAAQLATREALGLREGSAG